MMGIFLEYVMVYVAGKACEEHNACEGTAFEEWTQPSKSGIKKLN